MAAAPARPPIVDLEAVPVQADEFAAAAQLAVLHSLHHQPLQAVNYDGVVDPPSDGDEATGGRAAAPAVPVPPPGGLGVAIGVRFRTLDSADLHIARWFNHTRKRLTRGSSRSTRKQFRCVDRRADAYTLATPTPDP